MTDEEKIVATMAKDIFINVLPNCLLRIANGVGSKEDVMGELEGSVLYACVILQRTKVNLLLSKSEGQIAQTKKEQ